MNSYVRSCPLCNNENFIILFEAKDRLHGLSGDFYINKCNGCGVVFITPFLDWNEIKKYYPEDYETYLQKELSKISKIIQFWGVIRKVNIIQKYVSDGRLLDVGCSKGDLLFHLSKVHRWELYGIEPDKKAASLAAKIPNVKIYFKRLEEIDFEDNYFDVITMWHVFEHISNPNETLSKFSKIIKPGGYFILALPNLESLNAKIFGKYWSGYDVPRHYYAYSLPILRKLFLDHGFQVIDDIKFIGEYSAFRYSLLFWLNDIVDSRWLKLLLTKIVNSLFFRFIMTPYFLLANAVKKGSTMVIITRKI